MRRLLLAAVLLAGCGEKPVTLDDVNATDIMLPSGTKIVAETMRQRVDLMRGLMFRESLAQGRGMLFVHPQEDNLTYWMYQTKIPLDIIFMDHEHNIVEISANTPPCPSKSANECPPYGGHRKAQYVLEVNAGVAAKNGLKVGDRLNF
jgi:uncharacterized membrane protein (UPF0127 family)